MAAVAAGDRRRANQWKEFDMSKQHSAKSDIQGEGDYRAAEEYDRQARAYAASGKAEEAAAKAAPRDAREAREMMRAEAEGRSRAKGGMGEKTPPGPGPDKPPKQAPGKHPRGKPIPEKLSRH